MTQIHNACSFQEWNLGHCREIKLADKFCQRKFVRPENCWCLLALASAGRTNLYLGKAKAATPKPRVLVLYWETWG